MLQVENQEELAYLNKEEICDNFWSKLRSDNRNILKII